MRFTDNASITSANMASDDILAGTDVSASADKKFSLANIADWLLNKFNGLSLAGSQQTVKSALDSLNSNLGDTTLKTVYVGANASLDLNMTAGARAVLFTCATSSNAMSAHIVASNANKVYTHTPILSGTSIALSDNGSGGLTVTNSYSARVYIGVVFLFGSMA